MLKWIGEFGRYTGTELFYGVFGLHTRSALMVMAINTNREATGAVEIRDAEYRAFTNFIGGLVRAGLLSEREASLLLVEGYWENERKKAADAGIDLDAQVREFQQRKQAVVA